MYLLGNLQGIFVIPLMYIFKRPVHKFEVLAFMIALVGIVCLFVLPAGGRVDKKDDGVLLNVVLMLSSFASLSMFMLNKALMKNRAIIHVGLFNLFTALAFILFALIFEDTSLDQNPAKGIFGWVVHNDQFKLIVELGLFATFLGSGIGYIMLTKFFCTMAIMNLLLFESILATLWGWLTGVDKAPSIYTILTLIIFVAAIMMANIGTKKR